MQPGGASETHSSTSWELQQDSQRSSQRDSSRLEDPRGDWSSAQHLHHDQASRPPLASRSHSFPPPLSPSSSPAPRPAASIPPSSTHPNAYHPYAPAVKKPLLFINTVPPAEGGAASTKPKRKRIMPDQLKELCELFDITDSPSYDDREKVGQAVGMTNREVQVWFQNRRAKVNRERAAAQEAKHAKATPASREAPAPLSSFTSRFAAASYEEPTGGIGEHSWRYRHPSSTMHPPLDAAPDASTSAFRLPPLPPPGSPPPFSRPPLVTARSHPGATGSYRQVFEQHVGQGLEFPHPPQAFVLPAPHSGYRSPPLYSPSGNTPSFFGMPSPSMSSSYGSGASQMFTPNPGSAYSASSGYFSHPDVPYSPSGTFSSPSDTFQRLTIESPRHPSFSPRSAAGSLDQSPQPPADPLIHLPPIVSPRIWDGSQQQGERERDYEMERARQREHRHQRSQSDTIAERLAPFRGASEQARPSSSSSYAAPSVALPTSPTSGNSASHLRRDTPSPQTARASHHQRRLPYPTSLSHTTARSREPEGDMGPPAVGSGQPSSRGSGGVGLGMLAMAGEMAMEDAETEKEKEARERYVATRKLSYNALRDQAGASEREGEI